MEPEFAGSERTGGTRPGGQAYAGALLIVAACTALAAAMQSRFELSNLIMVYLLGVVIAAIAFGRGPALVAAVVSVAAFDFGFVPPRFTFGVDDEQYLVTFAVMLVVASVIGTLTAWLREQFDAARVREHRTATLYRLAHDLAGRTTAPEVLEAAVERVAEVLEVRVAALLPDSLGRVAVAAGDAAIFSEPRERSAAQQAFDNLRMVGFDSPSMASGLGLHLPLEAGPRVLGVLAAVPAGPGAFRDPERLQLLRAMTSQIALALERCRLAEEAQRARTQAETERARSALLSSVSHDLRTPLAAITGAATSLRDGSTALPEDVKRELADTISEEARRLDRLIGNLLDMTRLQSGTLRVRKEWHSLEEVIGAVLGRLESALGDRPVRLALPDDLPLVALDDVLFGQAVANLIENAIKYAPASEPIEITAAIGAGKLALEIADRGPGIPAGDERRVFEKFYRGPGASSRPGAGLGLAICEGIVHAHGGEIEAANRPAGGAVFTIWLPLEGHPPAIEPEAADPAATGSG